MAMVWAGAMLGPAAARGADTFVDQTRPDDSGTCLSAATACRTISGALPKTAAGDTVFVVAPAVQTTYAENVFLTAGKSLVALSSDPTQTIIDNGTGGGTTPAVFIPPPPTGAAGGTVDGFTIRSDFRALHVQSPATVNDNIFDEGTPPNGLFGHDVQVDSTADGSMITENSFSDPSPTAGQNQTGISLNGSSTIAGNVFNDFVTAILAGGDSSSIQTISGNEITGARVGNSAGVGISAGIGNPIISDNFVHDPFFATINDSITGIALNDVGGNLASGTLRRNTVVGHRFGVYVEDANGPVGLDSDLLVMNRQAGLLQNDSGMDGPGIADVSATNVTIVDTSDVNILIEAEVIQVNANLLLGSSIIGAAGIDNQGSSTCSISFSRGPVTTGDSCDLFQTTAAPMFVGGGDYHLSTGSPMIDAGNPGPPALGSLDIDGLSRAVNGNGVCPAERDMGADEFVPATVVDCTPPAPPPGTVTPLQPGAIQPPIATRKKCKKGRKLKKGKCVKKKRKR